MTSAHGLLGVHWRGVLVIGFLLVAAWTFGADQPIITVLRDALSPGVIEVHVGELIRHQQH